jgi:serine/threonine protein kinase
MSYCINPRCRDRKNADSNEVCKSCGIELIINHRIRLLNPVRSLEQPNNTEIFEVEDIGTKYQHFEPSTRRIMKVLNPSDPKQVELMNLSNHPGIPKSTIDDKFTFNLKGISIVLHCLVMQKFEGCSLQRWIDEPGRLTQKLALEWLLQLVDILHTMHQSGFIHLDIKPSNIILQTNGQLALIDFGSVQQINGHYLAEIGVGDGADFILGAQREIIRTFTVGYTPQEQIQGSPVPQSDFYALGKTFISLLSKQESLVLSVEDNWCNNIPQISKPFAEFINWLIEPAPGRRPQNTKVIKDYLDSTYFRLRLRLYHLAHSRLFKVSAVATITLMLIGAYRGGMQGTARFYFNEGLKHHLANRLEQAKADYQQSLKFEPHNNDTLNNLAIVCEHMKDIVCAKNSYKQLLKLKPDSPEGRYNLASFLDNQSNFAEAEAEYNIAKDSTTAIAIDALSKLSRLKNRQGRYQEAAIDASEGLKNLKQDRPNDKNTRATLLKNLGWSAFGQRLYATAQVNLEEALTLDSKRTDAVCLLAQIFETQNRIPEAIQKWEQCLMMESQLPEVREWRVEFLRRLTSKQISLSRKSPDIEN